MSQVNEQNQANEQEETGAHHGDIVAPENEEGVRNKKGQHDHDEPGNDLGTPEAVLNGRATVFGAADTDEHHGHDEVKEAESEVDALHSDISIALLAVALDVDVVQGEMG